MAAYNLWLHIKKNRKGGGGDNDKRDNDKRDNDKRDNDKRDNDKRDNDNRDNDNRDNDNRDNENRDNDNHNNDNRNNDNRNNSNETRSVCSRAHTYSHGTKEEVQGGGCDGPLPVLPLSLSLSLSLSLPLGSLVCVYRKVILVSVVWGWDYFLHSLFKEPERPSIYRLPPSFLVGWVVCWLG